MCLAGRPGDFDGSWRGGVEEEEDEWVDGRVGYNGHSYDCLHTNILIPANGAGKLHACLKGTCTLFLI